MPITAGGLGPQMMNPYAMASVAGTNALAADQNAVDPYAAEAAAMNSTIATDTSALNAQQASQTAALAPLTAPSASTYPSYANSYGLGSGSPQGAGNPGVPPVTSAAPWAVNPWSMQGESNARTP